MSLSHTHQVHAAHCRHAAAQTAKAQFQGRLDVKFEEFLSSYPNASLERFCSRERARLRRSQDAMAFQASTLSTWLREWSRERKSVFQSTRGAAAQ